MVCDKCGFEHNNRSACPKCGARVIYVNEDYIKRRQEWEEAQKQGRNNAIPPGIMYSTRDEHNAVKKRADSKPIQSKGGPETVSLSFRIKKYLNIKVIKLFFKILGEKILDLCKKTSAALKRRFVKRRGKDNPVIRELKFDAGPDTLDESKLVVSHKVFKNKRKFLYIGAGVLAAVTAGIIITFNVVKNIDRSDVIYFDGRYAYEASNPGEPLFGSINGGITLVHNEKGYCLGYDADNIYLYQKGRTYTAPALSPEIIAYNNTLDTVIFTEKGFTKIVTKDGIHKLDLPENTLYTPGTTVSGTGAFFALTGCTKDKDEDIYSLYLGDSDGNITLVQSGAMATEILGINEDGSLIYAELSTAEYGIVNKRNIMYFDGTVRCLAEAVNNYKYTPGQKSIYYTDNLDRLYCVDFEGQKYPADEEVTEFITNILHEDELYYRKGNSCYEIQDGEPVIIMDLPAQGCMVIYDKDNAVRYCYDGSCMYVQSDGISYDRYTLMYDESYILFEEDKIMYILDREGILTKIEDGKKTITRTVWENALEIERVYGQDSVALLTGDGVYIMEKSGKKPFKIFETSVLNKVIYSGKHYYLSDKDNILWKVSSDGTGAVSLGNMENYAFTD
ncbi:MAG: hypothetical protein ACI4EN_08305 [Butyrivibrio sp.]